METQLIHGISLAIDYFNSVPGHWLYTIGVVIASIPLTALVVQWVKHLHFKVTAREMTSHFIDFVVLVTGFLMAGADFVLTNGNNVQYLPQFLLVVVPTIKALAPSVYTYSKAINGWFKARQTEDQQQRLTALGTALNTAMATPTNTTTTITNPASVSASVPSVTPVKSPSDLLQL